MKKAQLDQLLSPGHSCPDCPTCPTRTPKKSKGRGPLANALIGAAVGTIGITMLTFGGRKSR